MKNYYFDYAAATPLDDDVKAAMEPFFQAEFYNPSASYLAAQQAKKALEDARQTVGQLLGAQSQTITFTAGVTEANNIFIQGVALQQPGSHMLVSSIEHESVIGVVELLAARGQIEFDVIPVDHKGQLKLDEFQKLIRPNTSLVSVIHVHNELGVIQDLGAISRVVADANAERKQSGNKLPLMFHTDAAQTANYLTTVVDSWGIDGMSISAAKLYGPKQVGVLYIKRGTQIAPLFAGGEHEHGLRAGTQNVAGAVAMATCLQQAQDRKEQEVERLKQLDQQLRAGLQSINGAHLHVEKAKRVPSLTSVHFDGVDAERLVMELDERNIQLGRGSACNAASGEPSASLTAIGLSKQQADSSIRIAMGRYTTSQDVSYLLEVLKEIVE